MTTRCVFFVGPSLRPSDLEAARRSISADVQVRPPIQQGDLLALHADLPDVIAIIDGLFFQVPSVAHKEILWAMERGARVLGAASLGALRAAELDAFGMEGVGTIYQMYRSREIDGDDEVAVLHMGADEGFQPLSVPLVSLRYNLKRAVKRRIVSRVMARAVLRHAQALHFTQRSSQRVLEGELDRDSRGDLERLREFLDREAVDLKRQDALELFEVVRTRSRGEQAWPHLARVSVNHTIYLHLWERQYATYGGVPLSTVLALQALLSPSFARIVQRVRLRCVAVDEALERGLTADPPELLVAAFCARAGLSTESSLGTWLGQRLMSVDELARALRDRQLEERILGSAGGRRAPAMRAVLDRVAERLGCEVTEPMMRPGVPWEAPLVRELKLRGRFTSAVQLAEHYVSARCAAEEQLPGYVEALSRERLLAYATAQWGIDSSTVMREMSVRGVNDVRDLLEACRLAFVWERFGDREPVEAPRTLRRSNSGRPASSTVRSGAPRKL